MKRMTEALVIGGAHEKEARADRGTMTGVAIEGANVNAIVALAGGGTHIQGGITDLIAIMSRGKWVIRIGVMIRIELEGLKGAETIMGERSYVTGTPIGIKDGGRTIVMVIERSVMTVVTELHERIETEGVIAEIGIIGIVIEISVLTIVTGIIGVFVNSIRYTVVIEIGGDQDHMKVIGVREEVAEIGIGLPQKLKNPDVLYRYLK
jgi:hypothetical protein